MIHLKNVSKVYRTKTIETLALNKIDLQIHEGEFLSIMGPSGCGKSTLLNIMGLLDSPSNGEVIINGQAMQQSKGKALAQFRNEHLGFIFQSFHLINDLSVIDNVTLPLLYGKGSSAAGQKRAEEVLEHVGLSNRKHHFPGQLSGGQKQRVAIARALICQPNIILADEPTGNLDSLMGNEVMNLLIDLNQKEKTTIIMVTHDESMAKKTNRLIRLFDGTQVN